jgi:hypothetical protein
MRANLVLLSLKKLGMEQHLIKKIKKIGDGTLN